MRTLALLLIAALLPLSVHAAGKLYKWTDENGVTQYTDEPPPGEDFEERRVKTEPRPAAVEENPEAQDPEQPAAPEEPATREYTSEERNSACEAARSMYGVLEQNDSVRMDRDGDGEAETLNDDERMEQFDRARRNIEEFCSAEA